MVEFFFGIILLATFHFVYEGIILPSIRVHLRYRLFALRDRLRYLQLTPGNNLQNDVFDSMQGSINSTIKFLPNINLYLLSVAREAYKKEPELRERVVESQTLLESCSIEEIKAIQRESTNLFGYALIANLGGLLIYIIPILLIPICYKVCRALIQDIVFFPEQEVDKLLPC